VLGHFLPLQAPTDSETSQPVPPHISHLSPTIFLERAAAIEPNAEALYHITPAGHVLRRSYREVADRARGLAYYLRSKGYTKVGVLMPNTPAHLESIYGIVAAGGVIVPVNYRLKEEDVRYILEFAGVQCVIVDREFEGLLGRFREGSKGVEVLVDLVCSFLFPFLSGGCFEG
jgi:acyl-CoA synthetase (AMP-forming)/AMP-acid ligase II